MPVSLQNLLKHTYTFLTLSYCWQRKRRKQTFTKQGMIKGGHIFGWSNAHFSPLDRSQGFPCLSTSKSGRLYNTGCHLYWKFQHKHKGSFFFCQIYCDPGRHRVSSESKRVEATRELISARSKCIMTFPFLLGKQNNVYNESTWTGYRASVE